LPPGTYGSYTFNNANQVLVLDGAGDYFFQALMFGSGCNGCKLQLGNDAAAASHQTLSLELARAYGGSVLVAFSMNIAARLTFARGQTRQAVVLQAAADRVLSDASFVMFDEDAEVRARLMSAARDELGDDDFGAALAEGEGLDHDAAADLAAAVLAEVRGEPIQQEAVR